MTATEYRMREHATVLQTSTSSVFTNLKVTFVGVEEEIRVSLTPDKSQPWP